MPSTFCVPTEDKNGNKTRCFIEVFGANSNDSERRQEVFLSVPNPPPNIKTKEKEIQTFKEMKRVVKPKKKKRETLMGFWATEEEKDAIETNARLQGKSVSAFLRDRGARPEFTNNEALFFAMDYMGKKFAGLEEICAFSATGVGTPEQPIVRIRRDSKGTPQIDIETTGMTKTQADKLQKNFAEHQKAAKEMMGELEKTMQRIREGQKVLITPEECEQLCEADKGI